MSIDRADVLVVGGGPAGATTAFQLAKRGISVTLIDRARFPREKVCGESLSPGALARLAALGMWAPMTPDGSAGVPSAPIHGMRIRSPKGTTFVGRYRQSGVTTGLGIRRSLFDNELLSQARKAGARVLEDMEAISFETIRSGAMVSARRSGGSVPLRLEAKRVVVADGRRSFLARQLGFLEVRTSSDGPRRYAVRAHCAGVAGLSEFAEMQVGEGGYCGIAPLSASDANICYVLFRDQLDLAPRRMESDFKRHLVGFPEVAKRLEHARVEGPIRVVGPLRLKSKRQSRGPFIACGDTTGFLDPFTGEGIAHAIASATLCAKAVGDSIDGDTDAFRSYEGRLRSLRRVKGRAALVLYGLVSRRALADAAGTVFAGVPRLADAVVRLFGDQI